MNIGSLIASIGGDMTPLQTSLKQAKAEMDKADQAMSQSMDNFSKSVKKAGDELQSFGKQASLYLTAPLVLAGGYAVKMASDYEESINKVDVAFKNNSQQVKDWAKNTLNSFGIAEGTALDMAALFGDMGTSMGFTTGAAAEMSMSLVGLAGDLASFKNIGIEQATTALNGVFTGETESLKRLGVVMTEANLSAFALSEGIRQNYQDMSQAEKVALRYKYILSVTQNAQGDFARTQQGAANQMRIFQESLKQLAVSFGQVILPLFTNILSKINEWIKAFGQLDPNVKKVLVVIAGLAAALGPLALVIGTILKMLPIFLSGLSFLSAAFFPVTAAVAAVAGAMALFSRRSKESTDVIAQVNKAVGEEVFKLNSLFTALKQSNVGTDERAKLIQIVNDKYATYLPNLLTEKSTLQEIEIAQKAATQALMADIAVKETSAKITELLGERNKRFQENFGKYFNAFTEMYGGERLGMMMEELQAVIEQSIEFPESAQRKAYNFWQKWVEDISKSTGRAKYHLTEFAEAFGDMMNFQTKQQKPMEFLQAYLKAYQGMLKGLGTGTPTGGSKGKEIPFSLPTEDPPKLILPRIIEPTEYIAARLGEVKKIVAESLPGVEEMKSWMDYGMGIQDVITKTRNKLVSDFTEIREVVINMSTVIESLAETAVTSLAESIGNVIGGGSFKEGMQGFLNSIADWAIQLGKIMIAAGIALTEFWKAITAQPWLAVGLGAMLVIAGTAVKKATANNPGSGGGYSGGGGAPGVDGMDLSKQRKLLEFNVNVSGEIRAQGNELVTIIENENKRRTR